MPWPRCQVCGKKLRQVKVRNHYTLEGVYLRNGWIWKCTRHGEIDVNPSTKQTAFEDMKTIRWQSLTKKIFGD